MMRALFVFSLVLGLTGCGTGLLSSSTDPKLTLSWQATQGVHLGAGTCVGILQAQGTNYIGGYGTAYFLLASKKTPNPAYLALDGMSYAETPLNIPGTTCASGVSGKVFDTLTAYLVIGSNRSDTTKIPIACQNALRP